MKAVLIKLSFTLLLPSLNKGSEMQEELAGGRYSGKKKIFFLVVTCVEVRKAAFFCAQRDGAP